MKALLLVVLLSFANCFIAQSLLTPELLWKLKRVGTAKYSPDGKYVAYLQTSYDVTANRGNTDIYLYDIKAKTSVNISNSSFSEFEIQWGKGNQIYFLSSEKNGLQIWKQNVLSKEKTQISDFNNVEMEGFVMSPNENFVLTIEAVDFKPETKYNDLPNADYKLIDDLMYRHWNQWDDQKKKHIFLHKISAGMVEKMGKDLLEGESFNGVLPPFGGSELLAISNNERYVYYATKKLSGKAFALSTNSEIYRYDIEKGLTDILSLNMMGYDVQPKVSKDDNKIAWLSMARDGFEADKNDIIVYDFKSNSKLNITKDIDVSVNDFVWSHDMNKIYYKAPTNGTVQLFEYDFKTKKNAQLSEGWFDFVSLDASEKGIVGGVQSMLTPVDLHIFDFGTKKMTQITNANDDILKNLEKPTIKQKWVTTTDGKKMLVWHILPPNYDENKKYPTLLYCQGGPQSQVSQFFSYRWNFMLMASNGYVVVAPNRRGLPGFGQEWNDAISKDWGGLAMQDYLSAIDDASKESYVDKDKMGAVGASYGGYSVYYLAGIHEKRFKTFVSHCGLFNLESWYGTTEELFFANWDNMGPYWIDKNKAYYEKNSPHRFVANWDTPMFVIHGGKDFRVPESEGMQAFQAAQLKGLRSKFLYFPEEGHWVLKPQNGLVWHREFFEWLDSDLK